MRNFLIILGIIIVGWLAVNDTLARFEELDTITVNSTPSQEEMKSKFNSSKGIGIENKFDTMPLDSAQEATMQENKLKEFQHQSRENIPHSAADPKKTR